MNALSEASSSSCTLGHIAHHLGDVKTALVKLKAQVSLKKADRRAVLEALREEVVLLFNMQVYLAELPFGDFLVSSLQTNHPRDTDAKSDSSPDECLQTINKLKSLLLKAMILTPSCETRTRITGFMILLDVLEARNVPNNGEALRSYVVLNKAENILPVIVVADFLKRFELEDDTLRELNLVCRELIYWNNDLLEVHGEPGPSTNATSGKEIGERVTVTPEQEALARCNAIIPKIRELYTRFVKIEAAQSKWLSKLLPHDKQATALISNETRDLLKRIVATEKVAMTFTGPNSSGKSTLLNVLLGDTFLPVGSGHVTGRVCKLSRVSSPDMAQIRFLQVNEEQLCLEPIKESLSISLATSDMRAVAELIKMQLKRPEKLESEAQQRAWYTTIVEVKYPFAGELFPLDVDLYDIPGFSISDDAEIQSFLEHFIKIIKPVPVFVYANSTFADAEIESFNQLQALLGRCLLDDGYNLCSDIFLVNTHFELASLALDRRVRPRDLNKEMIEEELSKRYNMLRVSHAVSNVLELPVRMQDCSSWACVSSLDYLDANPRGTEMFCSFVNKLLGFAARVHKVRLMGALFSLLGGTKLFLEGMGTRQEQFLQEIIHHQASASLTLETLKQEMQNRVIAVMKSLPAMISALAMSETLRTEAVNAAQNIALSYDGKSLARCRSEATGAFRDKFLPWLRQHIIEPAVSQIRTKLQVELEAVLSKFLASTDRNLLLREVLKSNDVFSTSAESAASSCTHRIGLDSFSFVEKLSSMVNAILFLPFARLFSWIRGTSNILATVNAEFKKQLAHQMLDQLASPLCAGVNDDIVNLVSNTLALVDCLQKEVDHRVDTLQKLALLLRVKHVEAELDKMRYRFLHLEASILATRTSLIHPSPPDINMIRKLRQDPTGKIYAGKWHEGQQQDVAIKLFRDDLELKSLERAFLKEVHHSWILTTLASSAHGSMPLLPLLGVYFEPRGRWMLVYPQCKINLRQYLELNRQRLNGVQVLALALSVAQGLSIIHEAGLIHRNISTNSVLILDEASERPLAVLGYYSSLSFKPFELSMVGALEFLAPEVRTSADYSQASDVYSLGVLLRDLLPQHLMARFPEDVKALLQHCLISTPMQRPTARDVAQALEKTLRQ